MKQPMNNKRFGIRLKRIICVLLSLVLTAGLLPAGFCDGVSNVVKAEGAVVTNGYILETTTGINSGAAVEFFEISYTDVNNNRRKQLLFPNEDSLMLGRLEAAKYGSDNDIENIVDYWMGYASEKDCYGVGDDTGLRQYHTDQYYFTTPEAVKTIDKIDAFMGVAGNWTCQGLRIFKVDEIFGLRMAGVWSESWYIDFSGDLIAELKFSDYNWSVNDANYLRFDQSARIVTEFEDKEYTRHETQDKKRYGFRFDIADRYGAGFESLINEFDDEKTDLLRSRRNALAAPLPSRRKQPVAARPAFKKI